MNKQTDLSLNKLIKSNNPSSHNGEFESMTTTDLEFVVRTIKKNERRAPRE